MHLLGLPRAGFEGGQFAWFYFPENIFYFKVVLQYNEFAVPAIFKCALDCVLGSLGLETAFVS